MTVGTFESNLAGEGLRIGIVQARFNADVGHGLLSSCLAELKRLGVADEDILHVTVPGALEVPLALQKMAETQQFDALVALGAVIRGETAEQLFAQFAPPEAKGHASARAASMDLRTYGIGAQILRNLGVGRMQLLANPRKMPSMTGFDLEVTGYLPCPAA